MSRAVAVAACGLILAACSMSMPSFDMFRSASTTEVLRIESEPPGADARTPEGQTCRTPCELTVPATGEVAISFALQGYNPQTINVRAEASPAAGSTDAAAPVRMQPNPVYAELTPTTPSRQKRKAPTKKKVIAKKAAPPPDSREPAPQPAPAQPKASGTPDPASAYPSNYPWPPPPPPPPQ